MPVSVDAVLEAFDATGDLSVHVNVVKSLLEKDGHDPEEVATAIQNAVTAGVLDYDGGFLSRPP